MPDRHPKRRSIMGDFARAARRGLATVALGLTLASGAAGQTPAQARPLPDSATALTETPQDSLRAEVIRRKLIQHAQENFPDLLPQARTGYSRELDSLEHQLRRYLRQNDTTLHNVIIVLDPNRLDAAVALGVPADLAVAVEVLAESRAADIGQAINAAQNMAMPYTSPSGIRTYTQNPSAYPNLEGHAPRPCLIVPISDHAAPFSIPGMTYAQKTVFANTHEGWHCLDARYRLSEAQKDTLNSVDSDDFAALRAAPEAVEAVSLLHRKETFADVAALGDMIRNGEDPALIETAMRWRQSAMPFDYLHYSVPALTALKAHIDTVGTESFRRTDDAGALALYFRLTDDHALTPARLAAALDYLTAGDTARAALAEKAKTDADTAAGLEYAAVMEPDPAKAFGRAFLRALTPPDWALQRQMLDWDVQKTLEDKAFDMGGMVTPATLVQAYGALQDSLRTDMLRGADERVNREKMTYLKAFFTRYLRRADYVAANARFGVDIETAAADILAAPPRTAELTPLPRITTIPLPAPRQQGANNNAQTPRRVSDCGCGPRGPG